MATRANRRTGRFQAVAILAGLLMAALGVVGMVLAPAPEAEAATYEGSWSPDPITNGGNIYLAPKIGVRIVYTPGDQYMQVTCWKISCDHNGPSANGHGFYDGFVITKPGSHWDIGPYEVVDNGDTTVDSQGAARTQLTTWGTQNGNVCIWGHGQSNMNSSSNASNFEFGQIASGGTYSYNIDVSGLAAGSYPTVMVLGDRWWGDGGSYVTQGELLTTQKLGIPVRLAPKITSSAGTGGSISPSGTVSVGYGSDKTYTITPNAYWRIKDVKVDGTSKGKVSSYTFSNVTSDHTISAEFEANYLTVAYHTNRLPPTYEGQSGATPITVVSSGSSVTTDTVIKSDKIKYDNSTYAILAPTSQVSATGWHLQAYWADSNKSHNANTGRTGATNIASDLGLLDSLKVNDVTANIYAQWLINHGGVQMQKVDADTGLTVPQGDATLENAKYDITNRGPSSVSVGGSSYATNAKVTTLSTNASGTASTSSSLLPSSTYEIRESAASTGYHRNTAWGGKVNIVTDGAIVNVSDTSKFGNCAEAVIRGGVRVKKVDNDDGSITPQGDAGAGEGTGKTFAGTRYVVKNLSPNPVYVNPGAGGLANSGERLYANGEDCLVLIAGDDGIAELPANALPYGTYEVRETQQVNGYLLNESWSQQFSIRDEGVIVDLTNDASKHNKDTVQRGSVIVRKVDAESNTNVTQGDAHEDFSGTVYKIVNKSAHHVYAYTGDAGTWAWADPEQECATITTNTDGLAMLPDNSLPYGTYRIYEYSPTTGYNNSGWDKTFTITAHNQRRTYNQTHGTYIHNREQVIRGGLQIWKVDEDTGEAFSQGGAGDGSTADSSLSGAVYEVVNKSRASVCVHWPIDDRRWIAPEGVCGELISDEDGFVELPPDALPYGTYYVYEKTPPQGYSNSGWNATFVIDEEGEVIKYDQESGEFAKNKEPVQRGSVVVHKYDRDANADPAISDADARITQGDAKRDTNGEKNFLGTTYTITNVSSHAVYVNHVRYASGESLPVIVANADGIASQASLPIGAYEIEETAPVEGYLSTDGRDGVAWKRSFEIDHEGQVVTFDGTHLTGAESRNADAIIRGGLKIHKVDLETGQAATQGDAGKAVYGEAAFAGTTYTIWNRSSSYVYVQGRRAAPDTICATIETDANGIAELPDDALPYGTYQVSEAEATPGYLNSGWSKTFRIRQDGVTIEFDAADSGDHANQDTSDVADADRYRNYEPVIRGDVAVTKVDWDSDQRALPQGDAGNPDANYSFAGTTYWVYNKSRHAVKIYDERRPDAASHADGLYAYGEVCLVLTSDENGIAKTEGKALPYGSYEIREVTPVAGYLNVSPRTAADPENNPGAGADAWSKSFEIRSDGQLVSFSDATDGNGRIRNEDPVIRGGVEVHKVDLDTGLPYGQGAGNGRNGRKTFEGTAYEITSLSQRRVKVYWPDGTQRWVEYGGTCGSIVADADGIARLGANALPYGTYRIREVTPPAGYLNSGWAKTFTVRENGVIVTFNDDALGDHTNQDTSATVDADRYKNYESVHRGTVAVSKVDADTQRPEPQGDAKLEGTEYEILNMSSGPVTTTDSATGVAASHAPNTVCMRLYADATGYAEAPADALPVGQYLLRESTPPSGYANSNWATNFELTEDAPEVTFTRLSDCNHETVVRADTPITLRKTDADYHDGKATAGASLEGTQFEVRNVSAKSVVVDGAEYAVGTVMMSLDTDADGTTQIPGRLLPVGRYEITERVAPVGYVRNGSWICTVTVAADGSVSIEGGGDSVTCEDEVIRGDLRMRKIDENTGAGLPGVAFRITSASTGENHIVVTGEGGWLDTSAAHALHSHQTNANDDALTYDLESDTWSTSAVDASCGVWFAGRDGSSLAANDTKGALPYDTYEIEELRCAANRDYDLVEPFDVSVIAGGVSDGGKPVIDNSPQAAVPTPPQTGDAVTVYKEATPIANSKVEPAQQVRYTLTVRNTGATVKASTLVRDYIPAGTQYAEGSASNRGSYVPATDANNMTRRGYVEWVVRNIAPGEERTLTFDVIVRYSVGQYIRNTAYFGQVSGSTLEGDRANPQPPYASNTVTNRAGEYPTPASVQVEKTSDPAPGTQVAYGSTIKYTLHVENKGGSASGITGVYDLVPANTTLADNPTGTLAADGRGIGWLIPALEPGESTDLTFTVVVTAEAEEGSEIAIANQASWGDLSGSAAPATPNDFMDNTSNIVENPLYEPPSEQGMLRKSSDPLPETRVSKGDTIEYILSTKNETVDTWHSLLVRDAIPEGTAYVADSASDGGVFVGEEGSTDATSYVEWVLTDVAPGEEREVRFSAKVEEDWISYARNSATYEAFPNDMEAGDPDNPQPRYASNEVKHPVRSKPGAEPFPLVHIEKSADPTPLTMVDVGKDIAYALTVSNDGNSPAYDVRVYDPIPQGMTWVSTNDVEDAGIHSFTSPAGVGWTIEELPVGKTVQLGFVARMADKENPEYAGVSPVVRNRAFWSYANVKPDSWSNPPASYEGMTNTSNVIEHPLVPADQRQTGSAVTAYEDSVPAQNTLVHEGDEISYDILLRHTGTVRQTATIVRNPIPAGTEYVDGSVDADGMYVDGTRSPSGTAYVEWVVRDMEPDEVRHVHFKVRVTEGWRTYITSIASFGICADDAIAGTPANPNPSDKTNTIWHTTSEEQPTPAVIQIEQRATPPTASHVAKGDTIRYELEVTNTGGSAATSTGVHDEIREGAVVAENSVLTDYQGAAIEDARAVAWNIPLLEPGQSTMLSFSVVLEDAQAVGTELRNQCSWGQMPEGQVPHTALPNTSNTVAHPVDTAPKPVVTKEVDGVGRRSYAPGSEIDFTLTVRNEGDGAMTDWTLHEAPEEGLVYLSDDKGGTPAKNGTVWWPMVIAPGESQEVHVKMRLDAKEDTNVRNRAILSSQDVSEVCSDEVFVRCGTPKKLVQTGAEAWLAAGAVAAAGLVAHGVMVRRRKGA